MLFSGLQLMAAKGSYLGREVCALVKGDPSAIGHTVDVKGHQVTITGSKCNPLAMGGKPAYSAEPQDFETDNNVKVHWDGKVWLTP
mmetsp:Transcript_33502/g.52128  ORF Transcript_33502/g.52128 Transcript_33502/m.52128 type:complete len:86 (+) Transcript_33502:35-292(+)